METLKILQVSIVYFYKIYYISNWPRFTPMPFIARKRRAIGSNCLISCMSSFNLEFLEASSKGDKHFIAKMLQLFLKQTPQMMLDLELSLISADRPTQQLLLHKMPPTFKMIGFELGVGQLSELAITVKAGKTVAPEKIEQLKRDLAELYVEIRQWLEREA